jgi:hypothetical protein
MRLVHHHCAKATLEQMARPSEPILIAALGDMAGQARHNNARDPGHARASFGRLRDIHSDAAQSRKLSP